MHWWKQFVSTTLGQIIGLRIKTQLFGKLLDLSSSRNRAFQSREQVRSHLVSRGQPLPLDEGRVWSTDVDLFVL